MMLKSNIVRNILNIMDKVKKIDCGGEFAICGPNYDKLKQFESQLVDALIS